ncbi:hypothetical protein EV176_005345 [Coemansia sp. RSA 451]|nr:hypothetical protein LPJ54_001920 [Coemansia sp. RSA 1824]KAJ2267182.1 hypothetical protein EV176_005345 [Coemansia sp. RSA 451]KAJ2728363.1 hypothetical protein H4S00_001008 [Coemansia sp. D1744]
MKIAQVFSAVLAVCTAGMWQAQASSTQYSGELEAETAAKSKQLVPKSDAVIELDKHTYLELIKTRDNVVIEFYANWCTACHGLAPEFNAFAEAARKQYPDVVVARANIEQVEYLSSSFMVSILPELVFIRRSMPGTTPEVRHISAEFTAQALLAYVGGGFVEDVPIGGYSSMWCTPTNMCGHVGGLLGELVVEVDQKFNPFDIPPWSFMAIIVSVMYLVGQIGTGYLARWLRRWYHAKISEDEHSGVKPVMYDEYRSDTVQTPKPAKKSQPGSATKSQPGSATKRAKSKRSKKA